VNRVGTEGPIEFWGTSFVADVHGDRIAEASTGRTEVLYADCDLRALEVQRRLWPFFRDRRTDAYGDLTKRFADG
jgi:N-carbamoylputrescine amidase